MRAHLPALAGLLLAGSLLAGCGSDSGSDDTATDPGSPESSVVESPSETPTETPSATASTGKPVSVGKTCKELYRPPDQWMPRAIEFVHGSPSAEDAADAEDIVAGLATVEGHSLGPLAEDIAITREGVDTQRAALESGSDGPDLKEFDGAVNRLAGHCELYNG